MTCQSVELKGHGVYTHRSPFNLENPPHSSALTHGRNQANTPPSAAAGRPERWVPRRCMNRPAGPAAAPAHESRLWRQRLPCVSCLVSTRDSRLWDFRTYVTTEKTSLSENSPVKGFPPLRLFHFRNPPPGSLQKYPTPARIFFYSGSTPSMEPHSLARGPAQGLNSPPAGGDLSAGRCGALLEATKHSPPGALLLVFCAAFPSWLRQNSPLEGKSHRGKEKNL